MVDRMKVAIGLTVGLLLFTACSKSDDAAHGGGSTTASLTPEALTVSVQAYAAGVCGGMATYMVDMDFALDRFLEQAQGAWSKSNPTGSRPDRLAAEAAHLDALILATDDLIASIQAAGVPDVDGGQEAAGVLLVGFANARDALRSVRDRVDSIPTDDPAFATALEQLETDTAAASWLGARGWTQLLDEWSVYDSLDASATDELEQAFRKERC